MNSAFGGACFLTLGAEVDDVQVVRQDLDSCITLYCRREIFQEHIGQFAAVLAHQMIVLGDVIVAIGEAGD